jgi:hypothetical protein
VDTAVVVVQITVVAVVAVVTAVAAVQHLHLIGEAEAEAVPTL